MKTCTIIGVSETGGFGNFLADSLSDTYEVTRHGREDTVWKTDSDVVVLNMFDHARPLMQVLKYSLLFDQLRNTNVMLVAIGSTVHYASKVPSAYRLSKEALQKRFYSLALHTGGYQCKMMLVEPGSLDNEHGQPHVNFHLKQSELVRVIRSALELEQKFLHIVVRGGNAPIGE